MDVLYINKSIIIDKCILQAVLVEIDIEMTPRSGFDPVTHTYSRVVVIPVGNVPSIQTREESGS